VWQTFRRKEVAAWWTLPVALTGMAFSVAFATLSRPNQIYFDRYTYYLAPALVLGMVTLFRRIPPSRWATSAGCLLLLIGAASAVAALTEVHRADYKAAASVARPLIEAGNVVLFEQDSTIARYRPGAFPGVPIFIPRSLAVIGTDQAARGEYDIDRGRRPLILVYDLQQDIDGWTEVEMGGQFHMLFPDQSPEAWDPPEQAGALWSACQGFSPDTGSYLCVAAAKLLWDAGDLDQAHAYARSTVERIENPVVKARIEAVLADLSPDLLSQ
jgi:hypothetical protein